MSALSDALRAAQAQTLAAMQRAYLAQVIDPPEALILMDKIGCTDEVDRRHLMGALEALSRLGVQGQAQTPANGSQAESEPERASERQLAFIAKLADAANTVAPDVPLTKDQASEVISALKAGTYNSDTYTVPF